MRYFLNQDGVKTFRMQGRAGDGHYDIAKEVLSKHSITAKDHADHYQQMFRLKYVRVVEHAEGILEFEHVAPLTSAQKRFLREKESQGVMVRPVKIERSSWQALASGEH